MFRNLFEKDPHDLLKKGFISAELLKGFSQSQYIFLSSVLIALLPLSISVVSWDTALMVASNSSALIGFAIYRSMPAAIQRSWSPRMA